MPTNFKLETSPFIQCVKLGNSSFNVQLDSGADISTLPLKDFPALVDSQSILSLTSSSFVAKSFFGHTSTAIYDVAILFSKVVWEGNSISPSLLNFHVFRDESIIIGFPLLQPRSDANWRSAHTRIPVQHEIILRPSTSPIKLPLCR